MSTTIVAISLSSGLARHPRFATPRLDADTANKAFKKLDFDRLLQSVAMLPLVLKDLSEVTTLT
ncbi:hypothetical protein E4U17_007524 [Claviceps sp. LM77 group G4]|nr:hypothetical protein E4U17_007524 [Claviceps sp. LM77 group G4]KAG6057375.1 hypothetical protein E4U33_007515 [Claviceps sp. LM78 group G4]KAG6084989.1 hypothetical protein E4U16_000446 [Claviceps sp. LM84 group G4]